MKKYSKISLDGLVKFFAVVRAVEKTGSRTVNFSFGCGHGNPVITEIVLDKIRYDTQGGSLDGICEPPLGLVFALEAFMHRITKDHYGALGFKGAAGEYPIPDGWIMVSAEKNSWELGFDISKALRFTGVVSEQSFTRSLSSDDKAERIRAIKILPKILPQWRERETLRKASPVKI